MQFHAFKYAVMTLAACLALAACKKDKDAGDMTGKAGTDAGTEVPDDAGKHVSTEDMPKAKKAFAAQDEDPRLWLEEVEGEKALAWVRGENKRSLDHLMKDRRYAGFRQEVLEIMHSDDKITWPALRGQYVYNFWQDEKHVRGLWRRTSVENFRSDRPNWETLLNIDALAEKEGANWVYKGVTCLEPGYERCMISLSDGGKDATVEREFDLESKSFVENGFSLPEAKTGLVWKNKNSLLIATDWGDDTLTPSGYPFIVKELKRGDAFSDAVEIYRGDPNAVGAWPTRTERDGADPVFGIVQADSFFTYSYFVFDMDGKRHKIPFPPRVSPQDLLGDHMIFRIQQDWQIQSVADDGLPDERAFAAGSLLAFNFSEFLQSAGDSDTDEGAVPAIDTLIAPTERQNLEEIHVLNSMLLVSMTDNLESQLKLLRSTEAGWTSQHIELPAKGALNLVSSDGYSDMAYLSLEGYLQPDSLYEFKADPAPELILIDSLPAWFDADEMGVTQYEAVSSDGTKIPYTVVMKNDLNLDGNIPTLLYGYGGFQSSILPSYSGSRGRLWLENGGAWVTANIRGGNEFGPKWHQAGLKTKRQIIYDDFIAVAEDLVERKITRPEKLGAIGRSNGGLLMGVMLTQRPDLWNAMVVGVPLLDMLRYHLLLAGASWIDEYGDPRIAEERSFLEKLSPYHNLDPNQQYPEVFFTTSTKDDRVHPGHARKMAHLMSSYDMPFLYYENIDGGHAAAANLDETAHRLALEYVYFSQKLIDE